MKINMGKMGPPDNTGNIGPSTFEEIYADHFDKVFYWFLNRRVRRAIALELAQDTFVQAFKGFDTFRGEASPTTWIFKIARNIFKNYLRAKSTQKRDMTEVSTSGSGGGGGETEDNPNGLDVADTQSLNPEDQTLESEQNARLYGSLEHLPPQMRQCLELRLEGLRYREIADVMGISIETVKSHLHQGRLRLRGFLKHDRDQSGRKS